MTFEILFRVFLFGIALSADAFAVAVTDGLVYDDINKPKSFFIAFMFGFFQALMPLIGFFLVEAVYYFASESQSAIAIKITTEVVAWLSFALLLLIGLKMIFGTIKELKENKEEHKRRKFSYKEVFIMAIVTAIDALAVGIAFHEVDSNGITFSSTRTIFLHVSIIMVITFILSLIGVLLGKQIVKLFKGKYELSELIGGSILVLLSIWVILSHYFGL